MVVKVKKNIVALLFITFSGLSSGLLQAEPSGGSNNVDDVDLVSAPAFVIENLRGGKTGIADYRGKVVLLNFWATWCMPCREEMPGMETLWRKYKDQGLVVLAVSVDEGSRSRVEKFTEIFGLSFPVLLDPQSEVNDLYEVSNMPTSFFIDRNGKIVNRIVGTEDWLSVETVTYVQALLSQ